MSLRESHKDRPHLNIQDDPDLIEYRTVSIAAVVAVVLALLSLTAFLAPGMLFQPPCAAAVALFALIHVRRRASVLLGEKAAIFALAFSVFVGAAATSRLMVYRAVVRKEAQQVGQAWLEHLQQREPHKALQWTLFPHERKPPESVRLEDYAARLPRQALEAFLEQDAVRTLLTIGKDARIRYYDTEAQGEQGQTDQVMQAYAVTYHEEGELRTFFVGLVLERKPDESGKRSYWRIIRSSAGVRPRALAG